MGRAFRGLYDGKHIMFGNQISFAGNKRNTARETKASGNQMRESRVERSLDRLMRRARREKKKTRKTENTATMDNTHKRKKTHTTT